MSARKRTESIGFDQRPGQSQAEESQQEAGKKSNSALQVHQQYESIAQSISQESSHRLGSLASSIVRSREADVGQFCDLLEAANSGQLDLLLINQEMGRRMESRRKEAPEAFAVSTKADLGVDLSDLRGAVDCTALIGQFSTYKAIAGV